MEKDIYLLDGANGTSLWAKTGDTGPVWRFNKLFPDSVHELTCEFIDAGSDFVLSNTFSANRPSVEPFDFSVEEIIREGVMIAKDAAKDRAKVLLDIGPLTGLLIPFGKIAKEEAREFFGEMIKYGMMEKPDGIFLETFMDLEMLKIACTEARNYDVPLLCSMSFTKYNPKKGGRTMFGNTPSQIASELSQFEPEAIGLNCSEGPEETLPIIKEFSEVTDMPLIYKPNAGKPKVEGGNEIDFDEFAMDVSKAAEIPGVKYIGGCCGSSPQYIEALAKKLRSL
ncbi:MAG: homocysteine S-methyltransferase family protein [Firmicutes bacterium]|nr:homocysteine S-methyltransferase family protein [Bacillota bacterium]